MGWIMLVILLGLLALIVWHHEETKRREREAAAEANRRGQVFAFVRTLGTAFPPGVIPSLPSPSEPPAGGSWNLTERLLDDLDAVTGPVIGTVATHPKVSWPFVAARHAERGLAPERTVGASTVPSILPDALRTRGVAVFGRTGSGKTVFLRNLILQDLAAGYGVGVIAKEREFIFDEILPFIPESRRDDVVVVDPADPRPPSLNPFAYREGEDRDLKADEILSVLSRLFIEDGPAPRAEMILCFVVATLLRVKDASLRDVEPLLNRVDDSFRRSVIAELDDDDLIRFWTQTFPAMARDSHLPILNRIHKLLSPKVRAVLCRKGSLDVRRIMDERKILLIAASDGVLGPRSAEIVAAFAAAQIQVATMARANVPASARPRFHLYLDEFPSIVGPDPRTYESLLVRARKFNVALHLASQHTSMLPDAVLHGILGNVGTLIAFSAGAEDARKLGREFAVNGSRIDTDLLRLGVGEAYCKFDRTIVHTRMLPPPEGGSVAVREEIIRRSRAKYGADAPVMTRRSPASALDALTAGDVFAS